MDTALHVSGLGVATHEREIIRGVDFDVAAGERVAFVGRSGAGKSTILHAVLGLGGSRRALRVRGCASVGTLEVDLAHPEHPGFRRLRGHTIGFVPQASETSLDPLRTVSAQLAELDHDTSPGTWLERVSLGPEIAERRPHELSGGQAQRVALVLALATQPSFLFADEPWSALDGPNTKTVLSCLHALKERAIGLVVVTHDLARLGGFDRVFVVDDGVFVEEGAVSELLKDGRSGATRALVAATRRDLGVLERVDD